MHSKENRGLLPFDIASFLLIVVIGGSMHFVWDEIARFALLRWLAVFVPVNESNWEHAKLGAWPLLVWALVILTKKKGIKSMKGWSTPAALAVWSAYLVMFFTHAALSEAFGDLGFVQYVGSFMLGIAHGMMAFRIVQETRFAKSTWVLGAVLLLAFFVLLVLFTYYQPSIPLFLDHPTGTYGISN